MAEDSITPLAKTFYSGSGLDAGKPAAAVAGNGGLYYATDTNKIYQVQAGSWVAIFDSSSFPAASATVSTQAFGDAAAAGSASSYSKGDHKHAMPSENQEVSVITFTRDLAAASGDVAYTGVGFTPSLIIFMASSTAGGFGLGNVTYKTALQYNGSTWLTSALAVMVAGTGTTDKQTAVIKTMDADGFTLTWTKSGSPSTTYTFFAICLR